MTDDAKTAGAQRGESGRYGDAPLGKSVEQVEHEAGGLEGAAERAADPLDGALLIPAVSNANASPVPAVVNMEALHEDAGTLDKGRRPDPVEGES